MKTLVLGGARSGKSSFAENEAKISGKKLIYLATGWAGDEEMTLRIEHHKKSRGTQWLLIEEPLLLASTLLSTDCKDSVIVVDCLTLWLSNLLHKELLDRELNSLIKILPTLKSSIYFVSNEVGSGIVPLGELNRQFADEAGRLNQKLAKICDQAYLIVAGLPIQLKAPNI